MTLTNNHPNEKDRQNPPPPNSDNHYQQPPHLNHHHEEPPYSPLPPLFHESLIYLTHLLLHHNATCLYCDNQPPRTPYPNSLFDQQSGASPSCMPPPPPPPPQPQPPKTQDSSNHINNKPTFRVYTKAKTDFSLTIRDGKVVLAPTNPSDLHQHWIKDERFGINIKDEEGFSSFALINKATGEAVKYPIGVAYTITKYNPDELDVTVLWSMGKGFGDGYSQVRPVHNMHLKLDAGRDINKFGRVHDGAELILWPWNDGDHQKWTIFR